MTILNDKQIRELCICPETYLDEVAYMQLLTQPHPAPLGQSAMLEAMEKYRESCRLASIRATTQEMKDAFRPMIRNFVDRQVREEKDIKRISHGLSSFGYDVRLSSEVIGGKAPFVIFSNHSSTVIDPKFAEPEKNTLPLEIHEDHTGKYVIMPAHSYGMGFTMEIFDIPRDVNVQCIGKSTYARSAVFVNVTPIEAGFEGTVVIEVGNHTGSPVKIYLEEGIAQFQFQRGEPCEVSYADKQGDKSRKYQNQRGLVHSRV